RLVDAAVAEGQLVGAQAQGAAQQLVAEADPEERQSVVQHRTQQLDVVPRRRRVARTVGVEHRHRVDGADLFDAGGLRQDVYLEAARGEVVDRSLLDAEVEHGKVAEPLPYGRRDGGDVDR